MKVRGRYNTAFITIDDSGHLVNPAQFTSARGIPIFISIYDRVAQCSFMTSE